MRKYILLFAALVIVVNGVYALSQLGTANGHLISLPLLLGSSGGAVVGLLALQKRLRDVHEQNRK